MGEDKPLYLFVSSLVWLEHKMRSVEAIFAMGDRFDIVSTTAQIEHLKSELFGPYLIDMEILDENPSPEEIKLIKTKSPEFYKDYLLFQAGLKKSVKLILTVDPASLEEAVSKRIEGKTPPQFLGNNESDIISWVAIVNSPLLPMGSEIYVYSNGEDFLYQKNIHPYLSHEWKYIKRGVIRAYDPSMFSQKFVVKQPPEEMALPVRDSKNTPEFLRARFIAVLDEISTDLENHSSDHSLCKGLFIEAKNSIDRISGKASTETVTVMKRLYNEALHKFQNISRIP